MSGHFLQYALPGLGCPGGQAAKHPRRACAGNGCRAAGRLIEVPQREDGCHGCTTHVLWNAQLRFSHQRHARQLFSEQMDQQSVVLPPTTDHHFVDRGTFGQPVADGLGNLSGDQVIGCTEQIGE